MTAAQNAGIQTQLGALKLMKGMGFQNKIFLPFLFFAVFASLASARTVFISDDVLKSGAVEMWYCKDGQAAGTPGCNGEWVTLTPENFHGQIPKPGSVPDGPTNYYTAAESTWTNRGSISDGDFVKKTFGVSDMDFVRQYFADKGLYLESSRWAGTNTGATVPDLSLFDPSKPYQVLRVGAGSEKIVLSSLWRVKGMWYNVIPPISLSNGWNLIGLENLAYSNNNCEGDLKEVAWAFFPQEKKYGQYKVKANSATVAGVQIHVTASQASSSEDARLISSYPEMVSERRAVWIKNIGAACTVSGTLRVNKQHVKIAQGWNMVMVQPEWLGKSLSDVGGNCAFEYAWFYDNGQWKLMGSSPLHSDFSVFTLDHLGKGVFVNAKSDCTYKVGGEFEQLRLNQFSLPFVKASEFGYANLKNRCTSVGAKGVWESTAFGDICNCRPNFWWPELLACCPATGC